MARAGALGTMRDLRPPVLFGDSKDQELLLRIFREGQCKSSRRVHVSRGLWRSGLIAEVPSGNGQVLILHSRHPAIHEIRELLGILNGGPGLAPRLTPPPAAEHAVDPTSPLGHRCELAFRVLLHLVRASNTLSREELRRSIPDAYTQTLDRAVERLVRAQIVVADDAAISIAPCVPALFRELALTLGEILAPRDPRLDASASLARASTRAFRQNEDGAPLLFGSDVRLRNLLALAKHGPLYVTELRGLTGVSSQRPESRDLAPFGRGGLVRSWRDQHGIGVELDPAFPVALPLRRLLRKLEETYRLPRFVRTYPAPTQPRLRKWTGDRYALFGGPIATSILASIGVLGWTFEALCVTLATGYDRVVVKKALRALQKQGILEGDRPRGPGFNVRLVTVAREFPARDELSALLCAYADAWPDLAERVRWSIAHVSPRTREHLRRRAVMPSVAIRAPGKRVPFQRRRDGRRECLSRYYALTRQTGRTLSSQEIRRTHSNLYFSIRRNWGTFRAFREEAGLEPVLTGKTRQPNPGLREDCIAEYFALSNRIGFLPNTTNLNRLDGWLSERIRIQWGGFAAFCDDLKVYPARRHRSSRTDEATKREACRLEYQSLTRLLGYAPSSSELRLHTDGLYKRIRASWGSFEPFCDDIGLYPARRRHRAGPEQAK